MRVNSTSICLLEIDRQNLLLCALACHADIAISILFDPSPTEPKLVLLDFAHVERIESLLYKVLVVGEVSPSGHHMMGGTPARCPRCSAHQSGMGRTALRDQLGMGHAAGGGAQMGI